MTILKISHYYLSLPQKPQAAKDFFESSLETYVTKTMDPDTDFDLDLFIEHLIYENEKIELMDDVNLKEEDVNFEYDEDKFEDMIQEFFNNEDDDEDDGNEYYNENESDEED